MNDLEFYITITDLLVEEAGTIEYASSPGCRCMMCYEFQFKDYEGNIVYYADTLRELAIAYKKQRDSNEF